MSELNLIKTVLFNAANLNEALTRLTELGIAHRACTFTDNGYHVTGHDVTFWPTQSLRCPLAVCINGNLFDYDDRRSFLAGQQETGETSVPAASPDLAGGQLVIPEPSTDSVDKSFGNWLAKFYPKADMRKQILRTERRLKLSNAKGLSS